MEDKRAASLPRAVLEIDGFTDDDLVVASGAASINRTFKACEPSQ
jgi:hypothetical protein